MVATGYTLEKSVYLKYRLSPEFCMLKATSSTEFHLELTSFNYGNNKNRKSGRLVVK